MAADFNLQTHLIQMESRIREDIREVGRLAKDAQEAADALTVNVAALKERVDSLDTTVKWAQRGAYGAVVALVGYVWQRVTGTPHP